MTHAKKWEILSNFNTQNAKFNIEELITILLKNRGLRTKQQQEAFLHPDSKTVTPKSVGIESKQLTKALHRIQQAMEKNEQIVIFGDYDVDGICGTAILWETLFSLGAKVTPYIPSRIEEGYGLSTKGISNLQLQTPNLKLIITVDNGIVASDAVAFAKQEGIDVIITDHHTVGKALPKANAIVHTIKLCGTSVAYLVAKEIKNTYKLQTAKHHIPEDHLALVALATVADLVPLINANRALLIEGLKVLHETKRPGIQALCQEATIDQKTIGVYEIGHVLAPRLNAMGRIASAMDSLRLLCTKDRLKAKVFAEKLGITNKERQLLTKSLAENAILRVKGQGSRGKLLFVAHETYEEGVIGLVAGKLVEKYYRPSIVVSIGEKISKASARSIKGFNIIDFIRKAEHLLINAGGHPMAAGFTVATENITKLEKYLLETIDKDFNDELLERNLVIDCELPLEYISQNLYDELQQLAPFGMSNPEPTFLSKDVIIDNVKTVGKDNTHLRVELRSKNNELKIQGIAFGLGGMSADLKQNQEVDIVYTIDENIWNNKKNLQLKIKDIKI